MLKAQTLDSRQHPFGKRLDRLAIGRCEGVRVGPETAQCIGLVLHDLRGTLALPITEVQFLQGGLTLHRQVQLRTQLIGKAPTALQRRADQHLPRAGVCHGAAHLRPALVGQGIITAATQAALFRFTMAQQVEDHAGRSATAASAKVAICPCSAQARRNSGTANAAPLPSPRRKPKASKGSACSAASKVLCPGSAPGERTTARLDTAG